MTLIGYARCSMDKQEIRSQVDQLEAAGCDAIYTEHASGARADRPELAKCLAALEAGDTLVITNFDRLARSLTHMLRVAGELDERNVNLRSLEDNIDTRTPMGKAFFQIRGVFAELQLNLIRQRTREGLKSARDRGRVGGRRHTVTKHKLDQAVELRENTGLSMTEISAMLDVGTSTLYRALARHRQQA